MHRTWLQSISFSIFLLQWNHVRALQRQNALLHMKPVTFTGHRQVLHSKSCFSSATLLWDHLRDLSSTSWTFNVCCTAFVFRICRSCLKHLIAACNALVLPHSAPWCLVSDILYCSTTSKLHIAEGHEKDMTIIAGALSATFCFSIKDFNLLTFTWDGCWSPCLKSNQINNWMKFDLQQAFVSYWRMIL